MELTKQTQEMINNIKNVCATFGLGNASSEYKIITEIFLYKFLNDKFLCDIKKEYFQNINLREAESKLVEMSEEDYNKVSQIVSIDTPYIKKDYLLSNVYNRQNEKDFHNILDNTLLGIANDNIDIFFWQNRQRHKNQTF